MSRALTGLLLACVLFGSGVPSAPAAAAGGPAAGPFRLQFGISAHWWWLDQYLDQFVGYYRDLGVTLVRLNLEWKALEPRPGDVQWERFDRLLDRLAGEGFEVVISFQTIPAWAATDPAGCADLAREPAACRLDPRYADALASITRQAVQRYTFIRYWEFWNEPELWDQMGHDVGDYLPWLRVFYQAIKQVQPSAQVAATTLAGPTYIDWLYNTSDAFYGRESRPFDAIAFHPYNHRRERDPRGRIYSIVKPEVEALYQIMVANGDGHKRIWLTEYGWSDDPTLQASYLQDAWRWLAGREEVELASLHMLHDWEGESFGLISASPLLSRLTTGGPAPRFVPKEPYYSAFRDFPRSAVSAPAWLRTAVRGDRTRHGIRSPFLEAWRDSGGWEGLGQPLTRELAERNPETGRFQRVQYFERGRLELGPGRVALGLLGRTLLATEDPAGPARQAARPASAEQAGSAARYFPETGHTLDGAFLRVWNRGGGLARWGYPLTEPFARAAGGEAAQYFERGLLLLAPGAATARPDDVGTRALVQRGLLLPDGTPRPGDYLNPALGEY